MKPPRDWSPANVAAWTVATVLGVILGSSALAISVLIALWSAWWVFPAWQWFLVPLGVPKISFWHFIGLWAIFRFRLPELEAKKTKDLVATDYVSWGLSLVLGPPLLWLWLRWLATDILTR